MRVVITGAAGKIGSELADELSDSYELCLIDCKPVSGRRSIVADLAQYDTNAGFRRWFRIGAVKWNGTFKNTEVVIHLAEEPSPRTSWERALHNNIQATWNVLRCAAHHGVRRVVYASSLWAVRALENELAPACYAPDGIKIGSDDRPRPLAPYGIAKACGEITGRMLVDEKKLNSFLAVRLGWYNPNPANKSDRYDLYGISAQDIRSLFRRCIEAEFEGFHVVYGVSAQPEAPVDLSYTRQLLSWMPGRLPEFTANNE